MAKIIDRQNAGIISATNSLNPIQVYTNSRLALLLGIEQPPIEYHQSYVDSDVTVKVIL